MNCAYCGEGLATNGHCENSACGLNAVSGIRLPAQDCPQCANYKAAHEIAQGRVAELEAEVARLRLAQQDVSEETFEALWDAYAAEDDDKLTEGAQALKQRLRAKVGVDKLEAEIARLEALVRTHALALKDEHTQVARLTETLREAEEDAETLYRCVGLLRSFLRSGESLNDVDEANLDGWLAAHEARGKGTGE